MTNATQTLNVKCPKCDGRGHLNHFLNIDNGKCFMCSGAGTFRTQAQLLSAQQLLRFHACDSLKVFFDEFDNTPLTESQWGVNPSYYESWARKAAKALFDVSDREWSKAQLARLNPFVAARICAAGREMKTA